MCKLLQCSLIDVVAPNYGVQLPRCGVYAHGTVLIGNRSQWDDGRATRTHRQILPTSDDVSVSGRRIREVAVAIYTAATGQPTGAKSYACARNNKPTNRPATTGPRHFPAQPINT